MVSSKKTDANGKIAWSELPLGKYYIQESKTNDSLVFNDAKISVSIDYEGQTVSKVSRSAKGTNRVNMQKIQVFKSGEKDSISGLVKGLQGAEFTFKLHSEVNHVGWDNATTYAVITTDSMVKQIHHIFLTGNISSKKQRHLRIILQHQISQFQ